MKLPILWALLALFCAQAPLYAALRTVAYTGQPAPGAPSGATFSQLYFTGAQYLGPSLNSAGRTAFAAMLTPGVGGVTAANDSGIWTDASGSLAPVALEGGTTAGLPAGIAIQRAAEPILNSAGLVSFSGLVAGTGVNVNNNETVWLGPSGGASVLAREGSPAPGTPAGVTFGTMFEPALSDNGQAAFRALLRGTGVTADNDRGFWAAGRGGTRLVARLGDPAPGLASGITFDKLLPTGPVVNAAGQVAFRMLTAGAGVTTANDGGIWIERNGALTLVAREGNPAGSLPSPIVFSTLGDPSINRHGDVAFSATLTGIGVGANNHTLWVDRAGTLELAAREGQFAQGAVEFSTFGNAMINERGDLAFTGATTGWGGATDTQEGIWVKPAAGAWRPVATSGTTYGGLPSGVVNSTYANPVLNNAGQVAFLGTLSGPGVVADNDQALWVEGLDRQLRLVAREGDPLLVAPGVSRTILKLDFVGGFNNEQGYRSGLNDRGEVAFLATFTDGTTGVFVSDVAATAAGDFNGDGLVDGNDFLVWQRNLGRVGTGLPSNGDANGDGNVTAADLDVWKMKFGPPAGAAVAIPEPTALALCAAALAAAAVRRRANS
ncbi:MAG: hypothetical protein DCC67_10420 [Planctomycetota bacterium]|nr:MAG: hypothetical protein DCC67_10420 [Planctomycetota bacterium]